MMLLRRCPDDDALERFAVSPASTRIATHIVKCDRCRTRLQALCRNEALLGALRAAVEAGLDSATRARIARVCRDAAEESDPGERGATR